MANTVPYAFGMLYVPLLCTNWNILFWPQANGRVIPNPYMYVYSIICKFLMVLALSLRLALSPSACLVHENAKMHKYISFDCTELQFLESYSTWVTLLVGALQTEPQTFWLLYPVDSKEQGGADK